MLIPMSDDESKPSKSIPMLDGESKTSNSEKIFLIVISSAAIIVDNFWTKAIITNSTWQKPVQFMMVRSLTGLLFIALFLWKTKNSEISSVQKKSFYYGISFGPVSLFGWLMHSCGLRHLTIPTSEIIYSISIILTYYMSAMMGRVRFMAKTIIPTTVLILCSYVIYRIRPVDGTTGAIADETTGYILTSLAMLQDTIYTVVLNYINDPLNIDSHSLDDEAFLAGQSLSLLVLELPLLCLLRYTDYETLEIPNNTILLQLLIMIIVLCPIITYSNYKVFVVVSPLIVQMAFTSIGPLCALIDYILGLHYYPLSYISTLILMVTTCGINGILIEKETNIIVKQNQKRESIQTVKQLLI